MLNPRAFYNSRPDGFGILEIAEPSPTPDAPRRFVPLLRTELTGTVTGPLATLTLTQIFAQPEPSGPAIEALYRFPLPGDAAVTGVRVQFGTVEIHTTLKERAAAEAEYEEAKRTGRQAARLTRESPDVFTLAVAGIRAGEEVVVQTDYVQLARPEAAGWSLRVPLTTAPRFVREDEVNSRAAAGQPLAILRDPGHRFALDLTFADAEAIASRTHELTVEDGRVRLRDGEVMPDRDCVITWRALAQDRPTLRVWTHTDSASSQAYFLALCTPPRFADAQRVPREVILLVDHSGSMEGAKWEAANWAVERFLANLGEHDSFALGLFHDKTKWFAARPRQATPDAVREAVAFLRQTRDSGGTQLGVALEQALDRARVADTPSRHVLILTDAEVSDGARILRLADTEAAKLDRRRVSVLCIDSAPNESLASQLAERGGGVARFLTSNPDEDDVTTALDEVLADWSAPVLTGLALEVNRAGAEAIGRMVTLIAPGPASAIDIGDWPAGRPVWVIGRVPTGSDPLAFRLRTGAEVVAEYRVEGKATSPGLKPLFGADRVRRLETVMNAHYAGDELRAELARLGYEVPVGESKVYAENSRTASEKVVRELLVRESLTAGVPCAETAFVAVRSEAGQPVTETRIVANALPHGWLPQFVGGGAGSGGFARFCAPLPAMAYEPVDSMLAEFDDLDDEDANITTDFDPLEQPQAKRRTTPPRPSGPVSGSGGAAKMRRAYASASAPVRASAAPTAAPEIRIAVPSGQHPAADGAVLFDSASSPGGLFTFLSITFADSTITADSIDPELAVLLFVGDLTAPRARVKLADVLRLGGRRPLNIRRSGEPARLVLADPNGQWRAGVPALEIVLGWV